MKTLYDYDEDCNTGRGCPKFVLDEGTGKVALMDRKGNSATMDVKEFNAFIDAVLSGQVNKI